MYFSCGWRGASSIGTCFTRCSPKPTVWNGARFKPDLAKSWAMSPRPMWTGCSRWISAAETGSRVFGLFIPQKKWTCCSFSFDEFLSFSRNVAAATPVCGTWREPSSLDPSDLPPGATLAKRSVPRKRDRGESRSRPVMTMTTFAARNDEKEVSEGQVLNTNASLWKSGPLPDGPFFWKAYTAANLRLSTNMKVSDSARRKERQLCKWLDGAFLYSRTPKRRLKPLRSFPTFCT